MFRFLCVCFSLAFLWYRLIDHLRVEWTVNPQYTYGWAVPFLCLFLLWRRLSGSVGDGRGLLSPALSSRGGEGAAASVPLASTGGEGGGGSVSLAPAGGDKDRLAGSRGPAPVWKIISTVAAEVTKLKFHRVPGLIRASLPRLLQVQGTVLLALLYLPTRLVQEANPEWRLVSWALALEVIGLTLLLAGFQGCPFRRFRISGLQRLSWGFPVLFFLVAVPWPTVIEGPLVQGLTRANTATTVELVNLFGVPALQQGNTIEVSTGAVGIDEACSGIRSFQVTLMLALLFGEIYRLSVSRRVALCLVGFLLAFAFNVARTTLLACIAAEKGVAAMSSWHDPAGAAILVACFVSLMLTARLARATVSGGQLAEAQPFEDPRNGGLIPAAPVGTMAGMRSSSPEVSSGPGGAAFQVLLPLWLVFSEVGTGLWYRAHEAHLPAPVTWSICVRGGVPGSREVPLSEKVRQYLRFDEALNRAWEERGLRFQAIFLRWKPGRTAVHLARTHTPEACVTAAGHRLISKSEVRWFEAGGLRLPFRCYVFEAPQHPLHVYYCLWEDRASQETFDAGSLTYENRLEPVLAGRRLLGQRSLELAIWGAEETAQADDEARRALEKLVRQTAAGVSDQDGHVPKVNRGLQLQ